MIRGFEKISFAVFAKEVADNQKLYQEYRIPERQTKRSAGYNFFLLEDIKIKKGEIKKIPTGIKVYMKENEVLILVVRSSTGFKYNIRLCNQVGIIDSDYYNNSSNEGHIWLALKNEGDHDLNFKKGDSLVQSLFINYLIADQGNCDETRQGGLGSTDRGEE